VSGGQRETVGTEPQSQSSARPKYSLEAQADNVFAFLTKTFFQMPRPVQVVGWLVLLLLFVYLVLYPTLGVTYFQGKVFRVTKSDTGQTQQKPEANLRIHKGDATHTNEYGEFTLAVRIVNLPFVSFDFDFGPADTSESVSLVAPTPLLSLFNPNSQKIYYAPGSTTRDKHGVVVSYFMDLTAAAASLESGAPPRVPIGSALTARGLMTSAIASPAFAAENYYTTPTYTLRLRELRLPAAKGTLDIYFRARINGQVTRAPALPDANSRSIDRLTLVGGVASTFEELDIPIQDPNSIVDLEVVRPSFFTATTIGSARIQLSSDKVSKLLSIKGDQLDLQVEMLPPVAIGQGVVPRAVEFG
jgi:hypothetical protein